MMHTNWKVRISSVGLCHINPKKELLYRKQKNKNLMQKNQSKTTAKKQYPEREKGKLVPDFAFCGRLRGHDELWELLIDENGIE